jgi:SOS-response transcriptional repressor LexA
MFTILNIEDASPLNIDSFSLLTMENLSDRLQWAIDHAGIKKIDLAHACGVSRGAVSMWFNGTTKSLEGANLTNAAAATGVNPHWLATGKGPKEPPSTTRIMVDPNQIADIVRFIPRISWVQAGMWTEIVDHLAPGDAEEMIACHKNIGKHGFALKIKGKSMEPDFKEGDLVLIDPDLQPNPGDFVVAKNSEEEATFKRYRPRGMNDKGEFYFELVPLNEDFETMRSDRQSIQIIGVAIDHIRSLR